MWGLIIELLLRSWFIAHEVANWSAGPYPMDRDFQEVFVMLTASGRDALGAGVADDAIRESFGRDAPPST